jgi:hypothetical protein
MLMDGRKTGIDLPFLTLVIAGKPAFRALDKSPVNSHLFSLPLRLQNRKVFLSI